jgi:hypothetical protein
MYREDAVFFRLKKYITNEIIVEKKIPLNKIFERNEKGIERFNVSVTNVPGGKSIK